MTILISRCGISYMQTHTYIQLQIAVFLVVMFHLFRSFKCFVCVFPSCCISHIPQCYFKPFYHFLLFFSLVQHVFVFLFLFIVSLSHGFMNLLFAIILYM